MSHQLDLLGLNLSNGRLLQRLLLLLLVDLHLVIVVIVIGLLVEKTVVYFEGFGWLLLGLATSLDKLLVVERETLRDLLGLLLEQLVLAQLLAAVFLHALGRSCSINRTVHHHTYIIPSRGSPPHMIPTVITIVSNVMYDPILLGAVDSVIVCDLSGSLRVHRDVVLNVSTIH